MANNTREFYKKQLGDLNNSQLLEVMHGTPVGLMSTNVGSDRMKIALEILQERWDALEQRVKALERTKAVTRGKLGVEVEIPTVTGNRGRGRPKKVSAV